MNILSCYLCDQTFSDVQEAIKHLKIIHLVEEKVDEIFCIVESEKDRLKCSKTFQTFKGMFAHAKKCVNETNNYSKKECSDAVSTQVNKMNISSSFYVSLLTIMVSNSIPSQSLHLMNFAKLHQLRLSINMNPRIVVKLRIRRILFLMTMTFIYTKKLRSPIQ